MIRYLYADDLGAYPRLASSMFTDRAAQFHGRLGWDVIVDPQGFERDAYDRENPLYVIWEEPDGRHGGSMRFLPTTGPTMVNDHFRHLTDDVRIASPFIWECTRFCLAPGAGPRVSAALMLAGLELGLRMNLSHAVGVFDRHMVRVYRALGWAPIVLGSKDGISVGLWAFDAERRARLLSRAGVSADVARFWVQRSLGDDRAAPEPAIAV